MASFSFKIEKKLKNSLGRAGVLETPHGIIHTPAFVTVGTKGTVKSLTPEQVKSLGAEVVLANTYHLYLEPGEKLIKEMGGLGKMMNWQGPTMTDSGGFQAFSLGAAYGQNITKLTKSTNDPLLLPERKKEIENPFQAAKVERNGVMFKSIIDGSTHYFTPEKSIEIQHDTGADIIFAFDECTSPNEPLQYQREALDRTHRWAKQSLIRHQELEKLKGHYVFPQAIFGIVQGGRFENLRKESAEVIGAMDFDGFGIGGSFAKEDMMQAVLWINEILPEEKPRHLLGIGEPEDLFGAVENGCDTFDCVAATRIARNGALYTRHGKINILNTKYRNDLGKIDEKCGCYTCSNYTKAYVAHLYRANEILANTLGSIHNLYFIINLVKEMRRLSLKIRFLR